ncbi:hypothetical protein AYL99_02942 [Fonsecaea erecta]|uniref:Uncharacterized protein n=1 Tax=Fonsecaea erecta TaxID=1367422 RepID=A0A178ZXJ4_9EURO|nr:hypothetical protein AYL99_02942 [Fonsecaea erecta]OAP63715.1 hypothetical protein AYL99_02942 [Fonsecaea erecta]
MSHRRRPSSDSSSDWVSCSSSSSSRSASDEVQSTLKKKPWLTSWSRFRSQVQPPEGAASGPAHSIISAGAGPSGPSEPDWLAPSGEPRVPGAQSPNKISLSSHTSNASWARSLFALPFRRHHQQRAPTLSLTPDRQRKPQYGDDSDVSKVYILPSDTVTTTPRLPSKAHVWSELTKMDPNNPTLTPNLADLLTGLSSPDDASRKMAAFKLQSLINDPSFAEHFVLAGGLPQLRALVLESSGNTLAYSLASFARLLEVDQGWEAVNEQVVKKARYPSSKPSRGKGATD